MGEGGDVRGKGGGKRELNHNKNKQVLCCYVNMAPYRNIILMNFWGYKIT